MIGSRLLARNTALNLVAQVGPLLLAIIAVPVLIGALGSSRVGVLGLAWTLIGYFSLFDFGLGRALTQVASAAIARGDREELHRTSTTAIRVMFAFGLIGAALLAALTPWLVYGVLRIEPELQSEAAWSFYLLALSLPFALGTLGFRGLFEAHQHFGTATALRLPYALFNYVAPLLILPFSHSLIPIVGILVVGRIATWAAHVIVGRRRYPWLTTTTRGKVGDVIPLLIAGGWMTVGNIVSPLMVNIDRFAIGAVLSMAEVAYYVTPYEVVTKLLFVPAAVIGVFFPAFAATYQFDRDRTAIIFERACRFLLLSMFPAILIVVTFAREGLLVWVGAEFAAESTRVLQILAAGVLINSFAQVPFGFLQAADRAHLTAKLLVVELPVYIILVFVLGRTFGLVGFALAWTIRIAVDTAVLCWLTRRAFPEAGPAIRQLGAWLVAMTISLVLVSVAPSKSSRIAGGSTLLVAFIAVGWTTLMSNSERSFLLEILRRRRPPEAAA